MSTCSCESCDKPVLARGLCRKHYVRLKTNGTTDLVVRQQPTTEEKFWARVEKRGEHDCWMWIGAIGNHGYGLFCREGGGQRSAHRVCYELTHGVIPSLPSHAHGYVVMHTCDNRACVNPAHLKLGTQAENVRDMDSKGRRRLRHNRGEKHHRSKFTDAQRKAIVDDMRGHSEVAREYGTYPQVIFYIRQSAGKATTDYVNNKKDRSRVGAVNPNSRLTEEMVRAIRASTEKPGIVAKAYGIIPMYVTKIRQLKAWKHVS